MRRPEEVGFRHLWGQAKREELIETAEAKPDTLYDQYRAECLPLGSAICANSGKRELVRLAGAARSVPGVVSGRENQPRRVSGRYRS